MKRTAWMPALAGAVLAASLSALPAPAMADCKRDITRGAEGRIQFTTRLTARNRWRAAARERHGAAYAVWVKADRKTEDCDKRKSGSGWSCVASARPCN